MNLASAEMSLAQPSSTDSERARLCVLGITRFTAFTRGIDGRTEFTTGFISMLWCLDANSSARTVSL